jgi:hypothetical protein
MAQMRFFNLSVRYASLDAKKDHTTGAAVSDVPPPWLTRTETANFGCSAGA